MAPTIQRLLVKGDISNARILGGTDLGDDWAIGGSGDDADTFGVGRLGKVRVKGSMADSLIGAGLVSHEGAFDLLWMDDNDAFVSGSRIASIFVDGRFTGSDGPGHPFGVGAERIGIAKFPGIGPIYMKRGSMVFPGLCPWWPFPFDATFAPTRLAQPSFRGQA